MQDIVAPFFLHPMRAFGSELYFLSLLKLNCEYYQICDSWQDFVREVKLTDIEEGSGRNDKDVIAIQLSKSSCQKMVQIVRPQTGL